MKRPQLLMAVTLAILSTLFFYPQPATAQKPSSTSPQGDASSDAVQPAQALSQNEVITFSEYPLNTSISDQYADQGILFGGDAPFISTDAANPTSPVLSGSPRFRGDIEGSFVDPVDGVTPIIVESFSLDAGYFDELSSARIEWFDPNGFKLGQRTNTRFGIERLNISGGNIASWRISIFKTEPGGYAIDNVSFSPAEAFLIFRETRPADKDGSWGFDADGAPGFDHVGLNVDDLIYESHPGYPAGFQTPPDYGASHTYHSEDGLEQVNLVKYDGVQAQHTRATFIHNATLPGPTNSPVIAFEEVPINKILAEAMQAYIQTEQAAQGRFQVVDFGNFRETLSPDAQKGGKGTFTGVGLIERAAQEVGHHSGQGFIPNRLETISNFPLLSPQLLNYTVKFASNVTNINQWFQGGFDPVDFMITDPLSRKLGYTAAQGEINEIPKAFYSGDGNYEQFLIPNPVPGPYQIELIGLNAQVEGAFGSRLHSQTVNTFLNQGETAAVTTEVWIQAGSPGDLNYDLCINDQDVTALSAMLNTFTNGPNHPGDIDSDGVIDALDLALLNQLVALGLPCTEQIFLPLAFR